MPETRSSGVRIAWDERGQGSPVVFLHGLGGSMVDWEPQLDAFAPRHRVIRLDVRGHGRSDKPPGPYHIADFARDAAAVLQEARSGPAHVVGISMGGAVAFELALEAPEMVRSLMLVNTGPEVRPRTVKEHLMLWQRRVLTRVIPMERWAALLGERLFPGPELEQLRRDFTARWSANDPRAYRAAFHALLRWSVAKRLGEIRQPCLVVHAEFDYTPLDRKQEYAARLPDVRIGVIAGARHAVNLDRPAEFNRMVLAFIEELGPS